MGWVDVNPGVSARRPVTVCHAWGIAPNRPLSASAAPWDTPRRRAGDPGARLRCGLVVAFARALARPLAAGTSAVAGGAELVGHLRP